MRIAIGASTNTRELSAVPPERQTLRQTATGDLMARAMERSAAGDFRWCYTLYPTSAYASEAEMSLADYEDFYYGACLVADGADPLTAWQRASAETVRLAEWIEGHEEVRITAPGTDIKLGIAGRKFIPCDGRHNMPDGEFFTGPVEDSVEGEVTFHLPAVIGGREVSGVRLRFEAGKVVDASAERGEEFLVKLLDTDPGARRLGELGIGTNYGIDRGTREVLLDEKIGGTVHMAVGRSYPESGGENESAVHTDLVCDLRLGGKLEVDGDGHAGRRQIPRLSSQRCAGRRAPYGSDRARPAGRTRPSAPAPPSRTEPISTASTTVVVPGMEEVSRMLFSQAGRIGARRLVPVILT